MRTLSLVVAAGPDKGRRLAVGETAIAIGRGDGQTLQLRDSAVSRHHVTLHPVVGEDGPQAVVIAALSGVNPVWTLRDGDRLVLGVGDRVEIGTSITLGSTTIALHEDGDARSPAPGRSTVEIDARVTDDESSPRRLAALAALGEKLARAGSLQAVYRNAAAWAVAALPASRALLLSPDGSDVLSAASCGAVADLAMSRTLLRRVLQERRALWVRDVLAEPELADKRSVQLRGIVGAMAAPVRGLVFYAEWGAAEAVRGQHDEEALLLLTCAAHLVSALGESASERSQLQAATRVRHGSRAGAPRLVGSSPAMKRLQVFIERVAPTPATVLLYGESGTGKELVAALVHAMSEVAGGPYVAVNCAAIPEPLLESELFGHEKGAFTGAVATHDGVFQRADGGTLFLDEIGEMSLPAQARMLRVLETQTFMRVGGTREQRVSVRVVAATHRDLGAMVQDGRFRQDLLYRLTVIHTTLPPLRERVEDIEPLALHFCEILRAQMGRPVQGIAPEALEALCRYRWPGNVRELRNVIERALVLGDGPELELDDLPPELVHAAAVAAPPAVTPTSVRTLVQLETEAITAALAATGGNKARAAALLGIDRTTLYRKLKDLGVG